MQRSPRIRSKSSSAISNHRVASPSMNGTIARWPKSSGSTRRHCSDRRSRNRPLSTHRAAAGEQATDTLNPMKYRILPGTALRVSEVCLGSMTWGEQKNETEAHEQLDYAVARGINL